MGFFLFLCYENPNFAEEIFISVLQISSLMGTDEHRVTVYMVHCIKALKISQFLKYKFEKGHKNFLTDRIWTCLLESSSSTRC